MKALLSALGLLLLTSCAMDVDKNQEVTLQDATDSTYKVGQVWRYNSRPSEENSTFTVVKIEQSRTETIFHIYIDGLNVQTNEAGTKFSESVGHAPFSKAALDASKPKLDRTVNTLPIFEDGYQVWRKAFLAGEGGVFSIPVEQAVEYIEQTMLDAQQTD